MLSDHASSLAETWDRAMKVTENKTAQKNTPHEEHEEERERGRERENSQNVKREAAWERAHCTERNAKKNVSGETVSFVIDLLLNKHQQPAHCLVAVLEHG